MAPRDPRSALLTPIEEAMVAELRSRTLLPLDDVLGCLKGAIPKLTRFNNPSIFKLDRVNSFRDKHPAIQISAWANKAYYLSTGMTGVDNSGMVTPS